MRTSLRGFAAVQFNMRYSFAVCITAEDARFKISCDEVYYGSFKVCPFKSWWAARWGSSVNFAVFTNCIFLMSL